MGNDGKSGRIANNATTQLDNPAPNESTTKRPGEMEFLTPYDLHRRWGKAISLKTLANWRSLALGPPYVKMGGRVLYRVADVLFYENENRFLTKR